MHPAIKLMFDKYTCNSLQEHEQALREILQEITLVGLWRGKFFEHAGFYGGTALRIFYNLDRFSEDLDFTLTSPNPNWSWEPYGQAIKNELSAFGFEVTFTEKKKSHQTPIKSAFLKTPTVQELLKIGVHAQALKFIHRDTLIQIKIEIDTEPTISFSCEQKFLEQPIPVAIKCVNEEHLFAGKMYAALFRAWKGRVKGRDWYDMVWFIRKKTPLNLSIFSKHLGLDHTISRSAFCKMAQERIDTLDVSAAIQDCIHFVKDSQAIKTTWSKDFFRYWIEKLIYKETS